MASDVCLQPTVEKANRSRLIILLTDGGSKALRKILANELLNIQLQKKKDVVRKEIGSNLHQKEFDVLYPGNNKVVNFEDIEDDLLDFVQTKVLGIGSKSSLQTRDNKVHDILQYCLKKHLRYKKSIVHSLKKKIYLSQFNILYPSSGNVDIEKLDITLLTFLLLNTFQLSPTGNKNEMPLDQNTSVADDILRLRLYRNKLCHNESYDFHDIWSKITDVLVRHLGPSFRDQSDNLKDGNIDPEHERQWQEIFDNWYDSGKEVMDQIQQINHEINALKKQLDEAKDTRRPFLLVKEDLFKKSVRRWKEEDKTFYETRASNDIANALEAKNVVTITGAPGSGKSMIAQHVALKFKMKGYNLYPLRHPDEIKEHYDKMKKQMFLFDEPVGQHQVNEIEVSSWKRYDEFVRLITQDPNLKLLITLKSQLVNDNSLQESRTILTMNQINITSDLLMLDEEEKRCMFKCHCPNDAPFEEVLSCQFHCFPLLCHLYSKGDGYRDVFVNPVGVLIQEFSRIQEHNHAQFSGMLMCAILNNLHEDTFDEFRNDEKFKSSRALIGNILGVYRLDIGYNSIKKQLDLILGVYVQNRDGKYCLIHRVFKDAILFVAGKKSKGLIFKHFPMAMINKRVRIGIKCLHGEDEQYLLKLCDDEDVWNLLTNRLEEELKLCNYAEVFQSLYISESYIVRFLLDFIKRQGTGINMRDDENKTMLHWAVLTNNRVAVKRLLECKINVNATDKYHTSALHIAISRNNINTAKLLLDNDASVNAFDTNYGTPLIKAAYENNTKMVELLLYYNAKLGFFSKESIPVSPFGFAVGHSNAEMAKCLILYNADRYKPCSFLKYHYTLTTPLIMAVRQDSVEIVKMILDCGIDKDWRRFGVDMALLNAVYNDNIEIVQLILGKYPAVVLSRFIGDTSLFYAIENDNMEIAEILLDYGVNINSHCISGKTALVRAIDHDNVEMVKMLLKRKADVNAHRLGSETALEKSAKTNNIH